MDTSEFLKRFSCLIRKPCMYTTKTKIIAEKPLNHDFDEARFFIMLMNLSDFEKQHYRRADMHSGFLV